MGRQTETDGLKGTITTITMMKNYRLIISFPLIITDNSKLDL